MRLDPVLDTDQPSYGFVKDELAAHGWRLTEAQAGQPLDWLGRTPGDRHPRLVAVGPLGRSDRRRLADAAAERGLVAYCALVRRGQVVLLAVDE